MRRERYSEQNCVDKCANKNLDRVLRDRLVYYRGGVHLRVAISARIVRIVPNCFKQKIIRTFSRRSRARSGFGIGELAFLLEIPEFSLRKNGK